jgi:hypothetical protein
MDLEFTPEDIADAKVRAAEAFNELPPLISSVTENNLGGKLFFKYGVAHQLYLTALMKWQRSDIDFSAGGVTTNMVQKRIDHIKSNLPMFKSEFVTGARTLKATINHRRCNRRYT